MQNDNNPDNLDNLSVQEINTMFQDIVKFPEDDPVIEIAGNPVGHYASDGCGK